MPDPFQMTAETAGNSAPVTELCLLVVEDDEADAYLICRALKGHPAVGEVVHAPDGVEALEMIERGEVRPDLAFIDLHMPRKNGLSLLVDLACRELRFPTVVLTSSAAPVDAMRSRLRGAIQVVTKPDTLEQLEKALMGAIYGAYPAAVRSPRIGPVRPPAGRQ